MSKLIDAFVDRLGVDQIATEEDLRGCTTDEIGVLEFKYGVTLPIIYRRFLERLGHESGRLFKYDHLATSYEHVLDMTAEARRYAVLEGEVDRFKEVITQIDLIILGRLGEQFYFIRCDRTDDSAVYFFNNSSFESGLAYGSVVEYLNAIADECVEAIESGYFRNSEKS